MEKLRDAAIKIQRYVRTYLQRREFVAQRRSAVIIQSWVRRFLARKRYTTLRKGIVRAQANFRATRQRRLYKELRVILPWLIITVLKITFSCASNNHLFI